MPRPIVSTCRIKRGKYLWGVWDSYDPKREDPPLESGIAPTHEEAREQARLAGGPDAVEESSYANSWYAWNRHAFVPGFSILEVGPGQVFWVSFNWYDKRTGDYGSVTQGQAPTVESAYSQALAAAGSGATDLGEEAIRAYRIKGPSRHQRSARVFRSSASLFEENAFVELRIEEPDSVDEVKEAYRAGALRTHPDAGGSPDAFVKLEAAYRTAMNFCSRSGIQ